MLNLKGVCRKYRNAEKMEKTNKKTTKTKH